MFSSASLRAATVSFDGNGTGSITLDTPNNWSTNANPVTTDQANFTDAAFGAALPASLTNATAQTWGNLIWDSNSTATISGAGTLTLSGGAGSADLITLGSNVTSGTLTLGTTGNGLYRLGATSGNINVVNAGATLAITSQANMSTGTITKTGAGTLVYSNGNNAGGGVTAKFVLDGGTLRLNNAAGFGGGSTTTLEIHGGTFLDSGAANLVLSRNFLQSWTGDFTFNGTQNMNLGTGIVTLSGSGSARTVTVAASTLTEGGIIQGAYGLTKAGAGTLQLTGASTFTGPVTILGGSLALSGGSDRLAAGSEVIIANGTSAATSGIFNLGGQNQTVAKLSSTGAGATLGSVRNTTTATTATLTVTGTSTFDGILRDNSGSGTGKIALTKSTGGTLTLTGTNTYTGATTVSGGTLLVNGSLAAGSAVSVGSGTLGGSGTVAALVTTAGTTSVISPGNSPGTLTLSGGLNAAAGADFVFELGTSSDLLSLGSGVFTGSSAAAGLVFEFSDSGGLSAGTAYTLITFGSSSGLDATDLLANTLPSGFVLDSSFGTNGFLINGTNLQVQFSAVPEPSVYALLGLGLGALWFLRRKKSAV